MINTKINLLIGIFFLLFFRVCFSEAQISSSNWVPAVNALPATTSASSMTAYRDRFYLATYDMTNQLGGCSYIYSYQSFNQLKNVS